jgi:hypothetical protein
MNAAVLMRQLADAGIRLSATGDRLHVEAKPGTVTRGLRGLLVNRKIDLLAELTGTRGRYCNWLKLTESIRHLFMSSQPLTSTASAARRMKPYWLAFVRLGTMPTGALAVSLRVTQLRSYAAPAALYGCLLRLPPSYRGCTGRRMYSAALGVTYAKTGYRSRAHRFSAAHVQALSPTRSIRHAVGDRAGRALINPDSGR